MMDAPQDSQLHRNHFDRKSRSRVSIFVPRGQNLLREPNDDQTMSQNVTLERESPASELAG